MSTNLSKYEAEVDDLIRRGELLFLAMKHEQDPSQLEERIGSRKEYDELIKGLPRFRTEYQSWYSEAKALVRQILPDRLTDLIKHYERQPNRKTLENDNYSIEDYLQGLSRGVYVQMNAGFARMEQQLSIVKSARQRFKSSLFDIRQLVTADLFDSEIDAARVLAKAKFHRAAGAICGVILEKHLALVCQNHNIKIGKKNPTISDLNDELKNSGVIDTAQWRTNQFLGDIRNLCSHNKSADPTLEQVNDLISGVDKVLKTII